MADKSALSLPISQYSIEEAAKILGCEPAAVLRMAGDGGLPVFVHLEQLCGVAQCVVSPVAVGESVGDGTGRVRADGYDHLIFRNLQYGAELFISRVPEGVASWWNNAWVTLDGFWQVDAGSLKEFGRKDGAPVMLSAWSDDCGGPLIVAGDLPSPTGDPDMWVMADDLRRLVGVESAPSAVTKAAVKEPSATKGPNVNTYRTIKILASLVPGVDITNPTGAYEAINQKLAAMGEPELPVTDRAFRTWFSK